MLKFLWIPGVTLYYFMYHWIKLANVYLGCLSIWHPKFYWVHGHTHIHLRATRGLLLLYGAECSRWSTGRVAHTLTLWPFAKSSLPVFGHCHERQWPATSLSLWCSGQILILRLYWPRSKLESASTFPALSKLVWYLRLASMLGEIHWRRYFALEFSSWEVFNNWFKFYVTYKTIQIFCFFLCLFWQLMFSKYFV